jgi:hypothetical protein
MSRVVVALFDAATLGSIAQEPQAPAAGYLAFAASGLFLCGTALLPAPRAPAPEPASGMHLREA